MAVSIQEVGIGANGSIFLGSRCRAPAENAEVSHYNAALPRPCCKQRLRVRRRGGNSRLPRLVESHISLKQFCSPTTSSTYPASIHPSPDPGCHVPRHPGVRSSYTELLEASELSPALERRSFLLRTTLAAALAGGGPLCGPPPAYSAGLPFGLTPPLTQRLSEDALSSPGSALVGPFQLYYPQWLFGTWTVRATLTGFKAPQGTRFISKGLMREVADPRYGVDSHIEYQARFYSTLPDSWSNTLRVAVGQLPESAVIADRAFNARSLMNASLGYDAVQESLYDPRASPTRQTLLLSPLGPDLQPLGPRRLELYINNRSSETDAADDFVCSEFFRRVKLGVRQVDVADSEAIYRFHKLSDDAIEGRKRRAIYLQPQDPLYFEANDRAIALLDYDITMTRVDPSQDCVLTPKGITQCVGPGI